MRNASGMFIGKPEGKIPFERPRHEWEIIYYGDNWI
jgi:hypothetical protein